MVEQMEASPKRKVPTPLTILITSIFTFIIQFGLAIWGWGGWHEFWAHPPFWGLLWVSIGLVALAMFSGSSGLSFGKKEDRGDRWVLAAFGVIAILITYFSAYTDRIGFWVFGGNTLRWGGVAICAAGGVLRLIPVFALRDRFSGLVAIQEGHRLETHGVYAVVRNPSYVGMMASSLGWVLAFRSGVGVILTAALLIPIVPRIHAEERLLHEQFSTEYDEYRARTWRLVPWIY